MDKEKEHMSRLKDAVDMKVKPRSHVQSRKTERNRNAREPKCSCCVFCRELWRNRWRTTGRFITNS